MASFNTNDINFLFKFKNFITNETIGKAERTLGRWKAQAIPLLKSQIENNISKGQSPVRGRGRYKVYSPSYKLRIRSGVYSQFNKKITPVNLKLSGKMRRSLKGRPTLKGVSMFYSSPIAKYHNDLGAGKSRVIRRMLPGPTEQFRRTIDDKLSALYTKLFTITK